MYSTIPRVERICEIIHPKDIKVFYEDGKPYIYYKGVINCMGEQHEVEIPKMSMVIKTLEHVCSSKFNCCGPFVDNPLPTSVLSEVHAEHEVYVTITPITKKMSKADIEKALGYKVDIVD